MTARIYKFLLNQLCTAPKIFRTVIINPLIDRGSAFYLLTGIFNTYLGDLSNTGWEVTLGGYPLDGQKFKWFSSMNISGNISHNINNRDVYVVVVGEEKRDRTYALVVAACWFFVRLKREQMPVISSTVAAHFLNVDILRIVLNRE